ncbi:hypothetical protein JVU11DRAFT_1563 [Chiua virens]|nr:hypothetical protein JVU11DRAFT_1563 [Chiua virens]
MSSFAAVVNLLSQIAGVTSQAEDSDVFGSVETSESLEHCRDVAQDLGATEHESPPQPLVNVSPGMCFVINRADPQGCSALSPCKTRADVMPSEENSQAPASSGPSASSQQPSPERLKSFGIKVRDFAYESTLPAIRPVSCSLPLARVPRQRQPAVAPRALKRSQRDWDVQEGPSNSLSSPQSLLGQRATKKAGCLERKPTEPLEEPEPPRPRALGGRTLKRLYSFIASSPRKPLPTPSRKFSASPPTSPLTPPLSHTPPGFPFVVHVEDTSALQLDSGPQPLSRRPSVYTKVTLDARPSLSFSSAPSPPQNARPVPLINSSLERTHPNQESGADPRHVRKRRGRGTAGTMPPSHQYYLRQRPTSTSRARTQSRVSHQVSSTPRPQPLRTRRIQ